ncbi:MAG: hydrogenase subunit MbhD domain-containing protein [Spirochaetota bacterium]|nr:hydrogenase subunit MbhD domain-containing protein [Spirochaetota bacterium]
MLYLLSFLVLVMLSVGIAIIFVKDILSAVILSTVVSLIASIIFLFIAAPDVAITEASIGAALTAVVFVIAIKRTKIKETADKE